MAVHYYDEDDIKVSGSSSPHVVINHQIELTDKEKKEAREKAMKQALEDAYNEMKQKRTKKKTETETSQTSMF